MRLLYLPIVFLMLLFSAGCKKESTPGTTCQISSITYTDADTSYSESYQFQNGRLFRITYNEPSGSSSTYQYTYGSNGKVSRMVNINDANEYTDYTYDNSGRLFTSTQYYSPTSAERAIYIYTDGSKYPVRAEYYSLNNGTFIPNNTQKNYTWQNGNLVQEEFRQGTPIATTERTTWTYDSRNPWQAAAADIGPIEFLTRNNITTVTFQDFVNTGLNFTTNISYIYNSQGFPISGTQTSSDDPNVTTFSVIYSNCQ